MDLGNLLFQNFLLQLVDQAKPMSVTLRYDYSSWPGTEHYELGMS
jgi:hypothetical protein